jgi:hypothetical protein
MESAPPNVDVALPMTARFVVVAVPETMRFVVEAEEVAMSVPIVADPSVARFAVREVVAVKSETESAPVWREITFAVFTRFPVKESGAW